MTRGSLPSILPMLGAVLGLTACAAESPVAQRVLVKLVQPSDDALAVASQVSASAGVATSPGANVSPQWHSVVLHCGPSDCQEAWERLRADRVHFLAVERDQRMPSPSPSPRN